MFITIGEKQVSQGRHFPELLFVFLLFLGLTLCLGVVGAVKYHNSVEDSCELPVPPQLFEDPTFSIICAQVIPNFVHGIFELVRAWDSPESRWESHGLFLCINILVMGPSLAAPIAYAVRPSCAWTQVVTIILSMGASFCIIFAGAVNIYEADRARNKKNRDAETQQLSHEEEIAALKRELQAAKEEVEKLRNDLIEATKKHSLQKRLKRLVRIGPRRYDNRSSSRASSASRPSSRII